MKISKNCGHMKISKNCGHLKIVISLNVRTLIIITPAKTLKACFEYLKSFLNGDAGQCFCNKMKLYQ